MAGFSHWMALLALPGSLFAQTPIASSDAADAVERLTGRRAHLSAEIRRLAGARMVGPAVTLQLVRDEGASLMVEGLKAIQVLEEAPPGAVVVVCCERLTGPSDAPAVILTEAERLRTESAWSEYALASIVCALSLDGVQLCVKGLALALPMGMPLA